MANLFEQYGIKEVADVTLFQINDDGSETPYLYLDSLKVSTVEQTAEQTEARGGKGNPPLIIWDFNKEINVTLEDALYTPKSMALMFGGGNPWKEDGNTAKKYFRWVADSTDTGITQFVENGITWAVNKLYDDAGAEATAFTKGDTYIAECTATLAKKTLEIGADDFPGTFKLVGDTYARNRNTGKDELTWNSSLVA